MQACRKFLSIFPMFYTVIINPSWKERKKAQSSTWCLNTLCFHFTLFLSGWSLKGNSKGKWKYFTQKIESICSAIWKLIGEKSWVFKTEFWQLEADVAFFKFFFLSHSLHEELYLSQGEWNTFIKYGKVYHLLNYKLLRKHSASLPNLRMRLENTYS